MAAIVVADTLLGTGPWFQLTPFLPVLFGYLAARFYMRTFKVKNPSAKALVATVNGTVLFWGSCLAFVCSLANLPTGW